MAGYGRVTDLALVEICYPVRQEMKKMNGAIEQLQDDLAQVDLFTRQSTRSGFLDFLVIKKQDLKVKMYQETGHSEPHVHIDYGNDNHVASFSISDGRRLCGNLDRKYERTIVTWIAENREDLYHLWSAAQVGKPVDEMLIGIRNA